MREMTIKSKAKKGLKNKAVWIISLTLFGLIIGIPLFMNIKNYAEYVNNLVWWQVLITFIISFLIGIFAEGYLKKVKLL